MVTEFSLRFGRRMEERRNELGLTRAQFARELPGHIGENQVYRWERGKHLPHPETQAIIARALKTTLADLLADDEEAQADAEPQADGGVLELLRAMQARQIEMERKLDRALGESGAPSGTGERLAAAATINPAGEQPSVQAPPGGSPDPFEPPTPDQDAPARRSRRR